MASWGKNVRLGAGLAAFCTVGAVSCSSPDKGSLVLAISTDMQAPQDISVVSIFVSNNGVPKYDYLGAVTPDGSVTLPATLALVESDNPGDEIHIRVTGFQAQKARVMRDVLTHIPHQTSALLRLPLNFLDDGSAVGTLAENYVPGRQGNGHPEGDTMFNPVDPTVLTSPMCDFSKGQTSFAGSCIDVNLDSAHLPAWTSETAVFGDGGTSVTPTCFDVSQCFAKAKPITNVNMSDCSFPLPQGANGSRWNCALATTDGTGSCANGLCLVPLETDPNEGFTVMNGTTIKMVPGVCKKIMAGAMLYADNSAACAQKIEGAPVCQPAAMGASSDGGTIPMGDGAVSADGGVMDATVSPDGGVSSDGGSSADGGTADGATVCQPPTGGTGGVGPGVPCADPDAGTDGGIPVCGGSCGSHSCAADPTTGQPVCQPSSGCHLSGESCTTDGDCCGASTDGGSGVTCMSINACGVGICGNATGCLPNGAFCRITGSATACNAPTNCCSSTLSPACKLDNMGVARCASLTCLPPGAACASSADCCAGVPCVPATPDGGVATLTCYASSCVPTGGPCTTYADCCSGLACTANTCVTHP